MKNQMPVWDGKKIVGYTTSTGCRKASEMLGWSAAISRVEVSENELRFCWVKAPYLGRKYEP